VFKEIRFRLAYDHVRMIAVFGLFVRAVLGFYRRAARTHGLEPAETGAITFVQRFGSSATCARYAPAHALRRPWVTKYRWPIYFFVAVAFWNLVGAGLFGFMINPPIALYYMQGLNTTPVHGHAALFGVYGMLGIGLILFCLRALRPDEIWREGALRVAFWAINGGLMAMILLSLLPVGLMQKQCVHANRHHVDLALAEACRRHRVCGRRGRPRHVHRWTDNRLVRTPRRQLPRADRRTLTQQPRARAC
jgi:hypothetical protein